MSEDNKTPDPKLNTQPNQEQPSKQSEKVEWKREIGKLSNDSGKDIQKGFTLESKPQVPPVKPTTDTTQKPSE